MGGSIAQPSLCCPMLKGVFNDQQHHERPRSGVQFASASGELNQREQQSVLRGIQSAGLLDFLRREPLGDIEFKSIPDSGRYFWPSRRLQINTNRVPDSYGEAFDPDHHWSISALGGNRLDAMRRSLVHELGHHLLWIGGHDVQSLASQAFSQNAGQRISLYANMDWSEYFCETLAAYAFHRAALRKRDPIGYGTIVKVREVLKI